MIAFAHFKKPFFGIHTHVRSLIDLCLIWALEVEEDQDRMMEFMIVLQSSPQRVPQENADLNYSN